MKKAILLLSLILLVVLFSGCVIDGNGNGGSLPYKNDIITIEDYYVSDRNPYEGGIVVLELVLKNNGEESAPRVEIGFDTPGFYIKELNCDGTEAVISDEEEGSCVFDRNSAFGPIESLDNGGERRIILTLQVRNIGILRPHTYTITYYIEYDYSGFRKMDIPIIDGVTLKTPLSQYSQSTATYGPIQLTFKPPERGERVEGGQTIKEYWGVRDSPFKVEMSFTHVGSSSIGNIRQPKIEASGVRLDLRGSLEIASVGEEGDETMLPCQFYVGDGDYLFSDRSIDIPDELMCNFQSVPFSDPSFDEPETSATIWTDFNYTYRYTNSQDFEIQPLPEESPTTTTEETTTTTAPATTTTTTLPTTTTTNPPPPPP